VAVLGWPTESAAELPCGPHLPRHRLQR